MTDMVQRRLDELAGRVRSVEGRLRAVERGMRWRVPSAIGLDDEEGADAAAEEEAAALRDAMGFEPATGGPAELTPAEGVRAMEPRAQLSGRGVVAHPVPLVQPQVPEAPEISRSM